MNELCEAQKLIQAGKLYSLKADIDLENTEMALKLTVPGIEATKEAIFNLSQSSEVIISILCSEIPFVISDLLSVISRPVFYKGCLVMEVNGKLALLYQTMHSLQIDLSSLARNMRLRRRVEFERLFWLKTRRSMPELKHNRLIWCPAKEVYREHLRKIIDLKLCHHLVSGGMQRINSRIGIITELAALRKQADNKTSLDSLRLPVDCFRRRNLAGTKYRYYSSMFVNEVTPSELMMKRAQQQKLMRGKDSAMLMEESWIEITCDSQTEGFNRPDNSMEIDENRNAQNNNENLEKKFLINEETKIQRRRAFSIRIFYDEMRLFYWGRPILRSAEIQEQLATSQGEYQPPKVVLLGVLEDCQEYLLKLFSSITEKGPTSFEICKPVDNAICMEEVLPEKFRYFINESTYSAESESIRVERRHEPHKTIFNIILDKKLDLLNSY